MYFKSLFKTLTNRQALACRWMAAGAEQEMDVEYYQAESSRGLRKRRPYFSQLFVCKCKGVNNVIMQRKIPLPQQTELSLLKLKCVLVA